jgi:hypothetical protein
VTQFGRFVNRLPKSTPPELSRALHDVFRDLLLSMPEPVAQGGTDFYYQSTEPSSAEVGSRWVDTTSGILYTLIDDGTSTQWVQF